METHQALTTQSHATVGHGGCIEGRRLASLLQEGGRQCDDAHRGRRSAAGAGGLDAPEEHRKDDREGEETAGLAARECGVFVRWN